MFGGWNSKRVSGDFSEVNERLPEIDLAEVIDLRERRRASAIVGLRNRPHFARGRR
jgi:hypothetical protein